MDERVEIGRMALERKYEEHMDPDDVDDADERRSWDRF